MPHGLHVGCLCVTEKRAPIFGIALASYLSQDHPDRDLLVVLPRDASHDERGAYAAEAARVIGPDAPRTDVQFTFRGRSGRAGVTERIDEGCKTLFGAGCDLVAVWDDDDLKLPAWCSVLALAVPPEYNDKTAVLCGSTQGWFCNLRTLNAEFLQVPHFWGGSLAFNKISWEVAGGFVRRKMPGYDRSFVADVPAGIKCEMDVARSEGGHIAFSHNKNVATWLRSPGESIEARLPTWYPAEVVFEVRRAQQVMVDTRTFPPWSGGN